MTDTRPHPLRLALYQPDIPQNAGAAIRLCSCLGIGLDIIEPCGFPWDDSKIRRAAMDYIDAAALVRHSSWEGFIAAYPHSRKILMTTKAAVPYTAFTFQEGDILIAGRESAGVPNQVHEAADGRVLIPMRPGMRSLNVINSAAMISGEALRQVGGFPAI